MRIAAMLLIGAAVAISGCGRSQPDTQNAPASTPAKAVIATSGSDTMVNLAQMWAEEYRKVAPNVTVEVAGGGSGVGIRDLIQGVVAVANSSREMEAAEKEQAKRNTGKEAIEWIVAYDALAVYVNKKNPVDTLTFEDLAGIYGEGGTIDKWSQLGVDIKAVGGSDEIVRVSRQNSSGTYVYFREKVLNKKDFKMGSKDMSGSKDVVELVTSTLGAVGYSGMGYLTDGVRFVKIASKKGEPGVVPSIEDVLSHRYPLARSLIMCTLGQPEPHVKAYIDWILSPAGQEIVKKAGYVPATGGQTTQTTP
jgi:phosphate transport system substrate-binding protein